MATSTYRVFTFDGAQAHFVDFNKIAKVSREVGGAFTVRWAEDGAVTITIFWEGTACP